MQLHREAATDALLSFLERQPLVGSVGERGSQDHHRPRGDERPHDAAAHHLALPTGQVNRQSGGPGRRGAGEEGAGEGQDLEAAVEGDDRAGRGGLAERDVGDRAGAAEHADAALLAAGEVGDGLGDVGAARDLHDVATEGVGAVAGDEDGGLGFVLGPRGAATGAAGAGDDRTLPRLAVVVLLVLGGTAASATAPGGVGFLHPHLLLVALGIGGSHLSSGKARLPRPPRISRQLLCLSFLLILTELCSSSSARTQLLQSPKQRRIEEGRGMREESRGRRKERGDMMCTGPRWRDKELRNIFHEMDNLHLSNINDGGVCVTFQPGPGKSSSLCGVQVEHMFATTGSSGSHELAASEMMKGDEKNRNICPLSKQQAIQFMLHRWIQCT
ncbi:unnamed protein product [Musa hybrid cultivar]